jgi:hybrid cluster-associated redox disulfide protein
MRRINKETQIDQILAEYPTLSRTFIAFGVPCLVCGEPSWGTVEELANQHRVNTAELLDKLNNEVDKINANS